MMDYVLETVNLIKKYKSVTALAQISLSLERGHIYGFIGENGAGKTTFLRIVSGLSFKTSGELKMLGETTAKNLEAVRRRIGSMIDTPALYLNLSARKNLELQGILVDDISSKKIDDVLTLVGLSEVQSKRVHTFSMGMKQRLNLALCLISKPEILLLDEPVNGLDPAGIAEFRELLKKLCRERNTTILMSSHLLSELYLLATDYIVIHQGKIVACLTHDELDNKCKKYLKIQMEDSASGLSALEAKLGVLDYSVTEDGAICLYGAYDAKTIATVLSESNVLVTGLSYEVQSIEEFYFSLLERTDQ